MSSVRSQPESFDAHARANEWIAQFQDKQGGELAGISKKDPNVIKKINLNKFHSSDELDAKIARLRDEGRLVIVYQGNEKMTKIPAAKKIPANIGMGGRVQNVIESKATVSPVPVLLEHLQLWRRAKTAYEHKYPKAITHIELQIKNALNSHQLAMLYVIHDGKIHSFDDFVGKMIFHQQPKAWEDLNAHLKNYLQPKAIAHQNPGSRIVISPEIKAELKAAGKTVLEHLKEDRVIQTHLADCEEMEEVASKEFNDNFDQLLQEIAASYSSVQEQEIEEERKVTQPKNRKTATNKFISEPKVKTDKVKSDKVKVAKKPEKFVRAVTEAAISNVASRKRKEKIRRQKEIREEHDFRKQEEIKWDLKQEGIKSEENKRHRFKS